VAAAKRTGGRAPTVQTNPNPRQVRAATGPSTGDRDRDRAYRQGQGAAKRALDERRRGRRTRGPAQVHEDPELQSIYEQGHQDTVRDARRSAIAHTVRDARRSAIAPAATTVKGAGSDGAGFVLGLIGFALLRNYLTGGWTGVTSWLAAKFINKTGPSSPRGAPPVESTPPYLPPPGSKPHVPVVVPPIFGAHPGQTEPPLHP
jgi:hypothetical protein